MKQNHNVGDYVTVTQDRDSYDDLSMEKDFKQLEGTKLEIVSVTVVDEDLVHYSCRNVDKNKNIKWAFIDADLEKRKE